MAVAVAVTVAVPAVWWEKRQCWWVVPQSQYTAAVVNTAHSEPSPAASVDTALTTYSCLSGCQRSVCSTSTVSTGRLCWSSPLTHCSLQLHTRPLVLQPHTHFQLNHNAHHHRSIRYLWLPIISLRETANILATHKPTLSVLIVW